MMRVRNTLLRQILSLSMGEKEEETTRRQLLVDELREILSLSIDDCLTSKPNATGISSRGSKRKRVNSTNILKKFLDEMRLRTIELQRIASSLPDKKEEEEIARRQRVVDELHEVPSLSIDDCIELVEVLFGNVEKTNCFLSLPKNGKHEYCMHLLGRCS